MPSTSDFAAWLEENGPDDFEEIYTLYMAVSNREDFGIWSVTTNGDKTFIEGTFSTLQLLSEKARVAFLEKVDDLRYDKELDIEDWYHFNRNMTNPLA